MYLLTVCIAHDPLRECPSPSYPSPDAHLPIKLDTQTQSGIKATHGKPQFTDSSHTADRTSVRPRGSGFWKSHRRGLSKLGVLA